MCGLLVKSWKAPETIVIGLINQLSYLGCPTLYPHCTHLFMSILRSHAGRSLLAWGCDRSLRKKCLLGVGAARAHAAPVGKARWITMERCDRDNRLVGGDWNVWWFLMFLHIGNSHPNWRTPIVQAVPAKWHGLRLEQLMLCDCLSSSKGWPIM